MNIRLTPLPLLLMFLSPAPARTQESPFPIKNDFHWSRVEMKVSKAEVDQFIKKTPDEFGYYRQEVTSYHADNLDSLRNCLHFLDINGDNRLDVIFDGQSGGEPREIQIFINTGTRYKKVFSDMQAVYRIEFRDNRLSKLYIFDWGCCAEYIDVGRIYETIFKDNIPEFVQTYQYASIHEGEKPDSLSDKPIHFTVLNNDYKIRSAPIVDDTSGQIWDDNGPSHGNVIGKLQKGSKGYAYGKKTDNTGREWWYVEIDEDYFPIGQAFGKEDKRFNFPTKAIGWISSRFVVPLVH